MERAAERLEREKEAKEMEVALLRERNLSQREENSESFLLVHTFENEGEVEFFSHQANSDDNKTSLYLPLSWWKCLLWSFLPSFFFALILILAPKAGKSIKLRSKRGEKDNGSSN